MARKEKKPMEMNAVLLAEWTEGNKRYRKYKCAYGYVTCIHPTDLTPEENARRYEEIKKASIKLLMRQEEIHRQLAMAK